MAAPRREVDCGIPRRRSTIPSPRERPRTRSGASTSATFAASLALIVAPTPAGALEVSTGGDGLTLTGAGGGPKLNLGGRVFWDADRFGGVLNPDEGGARRFNADLRLVRLEAAAEFGPLDLVLEADVLEDSGESDAEFHAAGVGYTGWDGTVRLFVGRTKEPFGLEELISSKAIATVERNYFTEATDADSQPRVGVRVDGYTGRVGWSLGAFDPDRDERPGERRTAMTGRVFGAPLLADERVLHLGVAYTDRDLNQPTRSAGFELDVAETGGRLDSSSLLVDGDRQWGLEGLFIQGPLSLQAERFQRRMSGAFAGPDGQVDHYYVQLTWAVTGEQRPYQPEAGITGLLRPAGGRGALELVAKLEHIRFDPEDAAAQTVDGYLVGANWYPNPNVRFMANLIRLDSEAVTAPGADDDALVFSTRVQVAF